MVKKKRSYSHRHKQENRAHKQTNNKEECGSFFFVIKIRIFFYLCVLFFFFTFSAP